MASNQQQKILNKMMLPTHFLSLLFPAIASVDKITFCQTRTHTFLVKVTIIQKGKWNLNESHRNLKQQGLGVSLFEAFVSKVGQSRYRRKDFMRFGHYFRPKKFLLAGVMPETKKHKPKYIKSNSYIVITLSYLLMFSVLFIFIYFIGAVV